MKKGVQDILVVIKQIVFPMAIARLSCQFNGALSVASYFCTTVDTLGYSLSTKYMPSTVINTLNAYLRTCAETF